MTDMKISELANVVDGPFDEREISFAVIGRRPYTVGEIIDYVAEQALKKVRSKMMRIPEVQIERPFRDPEDRLKAMRDFTEMQQWSYQDAAFPEGHGCIDVARPVYCNVEHGVIIWKFAFRGTRSAEAFNLLFDPDQTAVQHAR